MTTNLKSHTVIWPARRKLITAHNLKTGDRIIDRPHGVWTVLNIIRSVHNLDRCPFVQAQGYISGYGRIYSDFRDSDGVLIEG